MTLRLREDGTVVTVLLPEPIRGVPNSVALNWTDRKSGLLLRSVSAASPEYVETRRSTGQLSKNRVRAHDPTPREAPRTLAAANSAVRPSRVTMRWHAGIR